MKIRWTPNSLRLRITPTELQSLMAKETIGELLEFGGEFVWGIKIIPGASETHISARHASVLLALSDLDLNQLSAPQREGVYFETRTPGGEEFRYYIEKDYPCIHPRTSDHLEAPSETFSPPKDFEETPDPLISPPSKKG